MGIEIKNGNVICDKDMFTLGDNVDIETMMGDYISNANIVGVSREYLTINYRNKRNKTLIENINISTIKTIGRA